MTTQPAVSEGVTPEEFSGTDFRNALGVFATGVTVITTQGAEHPFGMTANAFSSVSLDPPLVLVCVISGTTGAESIERNGVFAVNILGADHEPISRYFSSKDRPRGPDAFKEIPHRIGTTGAPILEGAAGFLDCRVHAAHEAGDHIIFIGEVMALGYETDVKPLLFHGGRYRFVTDD
jgi:flavin reductase (DIM6/NTAB) family NADH-FMN oxidoreductase RutF